MSYRAVRSSGQVVAGALIVLTIALIGGCWQWFKASVQADVYRRQGVEMSTFEVLMGAKPVERTINVK